MSTTPRPSTTRRAALGTGLLVGALVVAGCGAGGEASSAEPAASGSAGGGAPAGDREITVVATDTPAYSGPLEIAAETLEADGWTVDITYVTDIVQPNNAVSTGEFDFNFFQHGAYLQTFNRDNGTDVVPLFYAVGSPAGVYSVTHDSIEDLPDGARIALPVDPANNGRALHLLAGAGLLELAEGAQVVSTSQEDITDNPRGFEFVEVDQQTLTQTLPDVDAGFLFIRQAIEMELDPNEDALLFEDDLDAIPYRIVFGGAPDAVGSEKTEALREAFQSDEVRAFYTDFYGDWAPLPWDEDPQEQVADWWTEG
ncbi:MetQ/NlpA family ABC transporter substrate-binding protein [Aquipuribacter hungaricus]|uniref:MetQ/NlpA family ABC transporter substrate-binding protein n=1 Tax=Aquipuribacter hungaricus TaxID=545624 RepID=A0ABV7WL83_9MICO